MAKPAPPCDTQYGPGARPAEDHNMPRLLIVDGDEALRAATKEHLSNLYEVIDTGALRDALAMALEYRPDAILLDLSMPGFSGFELCQVLSSLSLTQQIPIFVVSGVDERNRAFCRNLGVYRYFTKPVDFPKLKADLASVLASKRPDQRADSRVQLRVNLKLRGKHRDGTDFEAYAATENMSKGGFLCSCNSPLEEAATVEVMLFGAPDHYLGQARLVRVMKSDSLHPRYGFQFAGRV